VSVRVCPCAYVVPARNQHEKRHYARSGFQRSQALADGILGELGKTVHVQFVHDVLTVLLDSFHAEVERRCDFFHGLAVSQQLEHFALARRENGERREFLL